MYRQTIGLWTEEGEGSLEGSRAHRITPSVPKRFFSFSSPFTQMSSINYYPNSTPVNKGQALEEQRLRDYLARDGITAGGT